MFSNIYVSFVDKDTLGWQWIVSSYINLPSMKEPQWAWTLSSGIRKANRNHAWYRYDLNLEGNKLIHFMQGSFSMLCCISVFQRIFNKRANIPTLYLQSGPILRNDICCDILTMSYKMLFIRTLICDNTFISHFS